MLYKSEKLMRVSNPTTIYPEIANFSSIDSIIGKNNYTNSFSTSGRNKFITMSFASSDYPYKKFRVAYDSSTNFVTQISYTIREDFTDYKDSYSRSASGNTSDYVIVKAIYSNYQTSAFSNTVFSSGNYFLLSGSTYVAQPPYSDYEVFIASPNLIK
jgi:hypothetical protein